MYKIIDHTADIGIKIKGDSLKGLFVNAGSAIFDLMISSKCPSTPSINVPIKLDAPAVEQLMVRWLQELLFIFETRHLVLTKFRLGKITKTKLVGTAQGPEFNPSCHIQKLAIKAVTYHHLAVACDDKGVWHAEVIFDI